MTRRKVPPKKLPARAARAAESDQELVARLGSDSRPGREALRRLAFLRYVTEPEWGYDTLRQQPEFAGIPSRTWHGWAEQDRWAASRAAHFQQVRNTVQQALGTQWAQATMATLSEVRGIRERLRSYLSGVIFEGTEPDKAVRAYAALIDAEIKLSQLLVGPLARPSNPGNPGNATDKPSDTAGGPNGVGDAVAEEEARVAVAAVFAHRRRLAAGAAAVPPAPDDGAGRPPDGSSAGGNGGGSPGGGTPA